MKLRMMGRPPLTLTNSQQPCQGQASRTRGGEYAQQAQTLGWQPTCGCNADTVPATVLDPFAGSGTTLAVAQALGRCGVGVDLNAEYLCIARKRLEGITLPMALTAA